MRVFSLLCAALALVTAPLAAQVALPRVQLPQVGPVVGETLETLDETRAGVQRTVERLARDRLRAIDRLVRRNADAIEYDAAGAPARRGELLVMDVPANALGPALEAGFTLLSREEVEGLDLSLMRLGVPEGMDLAEAQAALALLLPQAQVSADNLHFQSGTANGAVLAISAQGSAGSAAPVGMIDGAPGPAVKVTETRGFAAGAPFPSHHGSSVASLLAHAGAGTIRVADVYGTDKAGGNALAMAKGLGWLVERGSKVVTISLVGPRNALLERAVRAAQRRGVVVVAAVGNDGPAAPPAYPASYPGVVAVTGVDGAGRVLIEAGRAGHLDYAAPGADMSALVPGKGRIDLRGTSFAAPLAAARIAARLKDARTARAALGLVDGEALHPSRSTGRGVVCNICRSGL